MVPQLSALSLALCHEVLEGGGYQQIRKKKLPLLLTPFAIHCLTKATAFVPQCEKNGAIKMEPSNTQKETSPLAHSVRNSLPHKSHRFCSPMRKKWSHILVNSFCCPTLHGSLHSPCNVTHQKPMPVIAFPVGGNKGGRNLEPYTGAIV